MKGKKTGNKKDSSTFELIAEDGSGITTTSTVTVLKSGTQLVGTSVMEVPSSENKDSKISYKYSWKAKRYFPFKK